VSTPMSTMAKAVRFTHSIQKVERSTAFCAAATYRRFHSSKDSRASGHRKEEYHIKEALRWMVDNKPRVTVQVENAALVGCNFLPSPATRMINEASVRIKCLTHADRLSDQALRYQIRLAESLQPGVAVIALNLQDVEKMKRKSVNVVQDALFGATKLAGDSKVLVCGLPNAGKSSLILPLTRDRTLRVRKKKHHHLPKVSSSAGRSLGLKRAVLEKGKGKEKITLIDSPGLRPRLEDLHQQDIALLLAAKIIEPFKGYKQIVSPEQIFEVTLHALNRHAEMCSETELPPYAKALRLDGPTDDVSVFRDAFCSEVQSVSDELDLIRKCQKGEFGGQIFSNAHSNVFDEKGEETRLTINRRAVVVCVNRAATRLVEIGAGRAEISPIVPKGVEKVQALSAPHAMMHKSSTTISESSARSSKPIVYPEHRRDFNCMICAGFVKRDAEGKVFGTRHSRVTRWSEHEILSYFSRMAEAFGSRESQHTSYLFKDSLACTLMSKHGLRSRRQAYKKFSGIKGYPVPDHERPKRFQSDQPIPWMHECTRTKNSCMTVEDSDAEGKGDDGLQKGDQKE